MATISTVSLASHLREHVQILWFHTCDLHTAAGPQPVCKSQCKIPMKHRVFELAVRGEIYTGSVWLFLILGQQRIKTHRTEPCPAAAAEENILENYATAPEKTPLRNGKAFQKSDMTAAASFESHSHPSVSRKAQIWGDSSLCLSWVISNVCLMISSLAFLYSSFSVVQLLSPTFLESAKCTNKCSSLPIKSGKQESCKFRRSNSTNPSCCDAADEGL